VLVSQSVFAQEAVIRKNIAERLPNFPAIDEVTKMPVHGLFEVRAGSDVYYTDASGNHLIQGSITDTRTGVNLTEERIGKLTAIDFSALPLHDAMVSRRGTGTRKIAVFADPNCGYCKKFEQELQAIKDVTVYIFLYPVLGAPSQEASRAIWCSKDNSNAWADWMLRGVKPTAAEASCDTAVLQRNLAFGQKHRIDGTPALVFEDGKRVPGAMDGIQLEKQLVASKAK
jgi:thiol:disulfide interchange protein DsbC